jgi:uncharacterized protein (TIGR03083 family)
VIDHRAVIAQESAAFLRAVRGNFTARVPSCPDWDVGDLTAHLGAVQRFHALHVVRGVVDQPTERAAVPEDDADLLPWFEEGTRLLLAALDALPADAPAWNWAPHTPQTVAFWPRRMALEAAVHRWDAENARHDAQGFEVGLAEDGIDEVLTVHHATLPDDVLVRLTDSERTWGNAKTPDAVLEGTASGVFLALWGRVPLSSLTTKGDESQVAALRAG